MNDKTLPTRTPIAPAPDAVEPSNQNSPACVDLTGRYFAHFAARPEAVGCVGYTVRQGRVVGPAGYGHYWLEFNPDTATAFTQVFNAHELRSFVIFESQEQRATFLGGAVAEAQQAPLSAKTNAGRGSRGTMLAPGEA